MALAKTLVHALLVVGAWNGLSSWIAWGPGLRHASGVAFFGVGVLLGACALLVTTSFARAAMRRLRRRSSPARLAHLGLAALAVPAAIAVFVALFPAPYVPFVDALVGASAAGVVGAWWLLDRSPDGRSRRARVALGVGGGLVLGLVGLELALRFGPVRPPGIFLAGEDAGVSERLDAARIEPGFRVGGFPTNARGYYDREWGGAQADVRVVCIGDSFSFAAAPWPLHYTSVAERELAGIELWNVGAPSIGPAEYRHLLESEVLPSEPDAVVVTVFVGNDLLQRRSEPSRSWRRLFDRERYLLPRVLERGVRVRGERGDEPDVLTAEPDTEELVDTVAEARAAFPWVDDPLAERPTLSEERFLFVERDRALGACLPGRVDFGPTQEELLAMHRAAGSTPIGFVLIPDEFQVEDDLWQAVSAGAPDALERDLPQRVLGAWLEEAGIPFLDLLPTFRAAPELPDGRKHLYHLRDTHWNSRGHALAGREVAAFVRETLLPEPR